MKNAPPKSLSAVMTRSREYPRLRARRSAVETEIATRLRRLEERGAWRGKVKVPIFGQRSFRNADSLKSPGGGRKEAASKAVTKVPCAATHECSMPRRAPGQSTGIGWSFPQRGGSKGTGQAGFGYFLKT